MKLKNTLSEFVMKMSVHCDFQKVICHFRVVTPECKVNNKENMDSHSTVTGIVSTPQTSSGNIAGIGH